jgi:hypothetical protein
MIDFHTAKCGAIGETLTRDGSRDIFWPPPLEIHKLEYLILNHLFRVRLGDPFDPFATEAIYGPPWSPPRTYAPGYPRLREDAWRRVTSVVAQNRIDLLSPFDASKISK